MFVGWSHHTALESRQVVPDVPSQSQGEAMGPTFGQLECMMWACADQLPASDAKETKSKTSAVHMQM